MPRSFPGGCADDRERCCIIAAHGGEARPTLSPQRLISAACEEDLLKHDDSFRGVGYTKSAAEAESRYALMLGMIDERTWPVTVLDLGCGLAHLLDYVEGHPQCANVQYTGLDISPRYFDGARTRHPEADLCARSGAGPDRARRTVAEQYWQCFPTANSATRHTRGLIS